MQKINFKNVSSHLSEKEMKNVLGGSVMRCFDGSHQSTCNGQCSTPFGMGTCTWHGMWTFDGFCECI